VIAPLSIYVRPARLRPAGGWTRLVRGLGLALALLGLGGFVQHTRAADDLAAQFDAANQLYAQSQFSAAAAAYNQFLTNGTISAALYFNLGNAHFKAGQLGRAIAAYRQAEALSPRDPDVRANLQFARNQVHGPRLAPAAWQQKLAALSNAEWLATTTVAVWITFALLILQVLRPAWRSALRIWSVAGVGVSVALLLGAKFAAAQNAPGRVAIVIAHQATVHASPFAESAATFTAHDGAELRVLDQKDAWLQVTDEAHHLGWIEQDATIRTGRS